MVLPEDVPVPSQTVVTVVAEQHLVLHLSLLAQRHGALQASIQKVPSSPPYIAILGPLGLGADSGGCCLNGRLSVPFLCSPGHLLDLLNSRHSCSCRHPVRVSSVLS